MKGLVQSFARFKTKDPESKSDRFTYRPLKSKYTIRLLKLRVREREPRVSVKIIETDLQRPTHVKYFALSYTWGSPFGSRSAPGGPASVETRKTILCNGKHFEIQENLYRALIRLWSSFLTDGPFWIHAICINQDDPQERSEQVQIMGDIYAKATAVAVWLGEHDEASRVALPIIQKIGQAVAKLEDPDMEKLNSRPPFEASYIYSLLAMEPVQRSEWDAINIFFSRTYFGRVWIAQELILSVGACFFCGDLEVQYTDVLHFVYFLINTDWITSIVRNLAEHDNFTSGTEYLYSMDRLQLDDSGNFIFPNVDTQVNHLFGFCDQRQKLCARFVILCHSNRLRYATDPRDYIYAPLSFVRHLAGDESDSLPKVNYNKSARTVFIEAANYFLSTTGNLGLLSFVHYNNKSSPLHLPSWVPAFNIKGGNWELPSRGIYNAIQPWDVSAPVIDNTLETLQVRGIRFDRVVSTTQEDLVEIYSSRNICQLLEFVESYEGNNGDRADRVELLMWLLLGGTIREISVDLPEASLPTVDEVKLLFTHFLEYRIAVAVSIAGDFEHTLPIPLILTQHCGVSPLLPSVSQFEDEVGRIRSFLQQVNWDLGNLNSVPANMQAEFMDKIINPAWKFSRLIAWACLNRKLIKTAGGRFGLGPKSVQINDEVFFLQGGKVPFLLRKRSNGDFELVGEAYIHGYMQGEIFSKAGFRVEDASLITIH